MRKMQFKRIGLTVLILALLTMLIVGTSVVSAIAKNTTDRSGASDAVASHEKEKTILLNSYLSNAVNNRSKWLYDLMIAAPLLLLPCCASPGLPDPAGMKIQNHNRILRKESPFSHTWLPTTILTWTC